jgi:hypothetical protein
MYNGVKAMIDAEKALCSGAGAPATGAISSSVSAGPVCGRNLKIEELTCLPTFPSGEDKSLLCKYLT